MSLGAFLSEQASQRGPWNCSTFPADWCIRLGYPDFAAPWRSVVDALEGEAIAKEAGGLARLWEPEIGHLLPEVTTALAAGDVGVLRVSTFEAGAIWTGARWAVRIRSGLHFAGEEHVELVKAWRPTDLCRR